jgi:hypothetical protein
MSNNSAVKSALELAESFGNKLEMILNPKSSLNNADKVGYFNIIKDDFPILKEKADSINSTGQLNVAINDAEDLINETNGPSDYGNVYLVYTAIQRIILELKNRNSHGGRRKRTHRKRTRRNRKRTHRR